MTTTAIRSMSVDDRKAHMKRLGDASHNKRGSKARLKRDLMAGEVTLDVVVLDPPWFIHGEPVVKVLGWGRYVGTYRARRITRGIVLGHEAIEHLSPPTRERLAKRIRDVMGLE